MGDLSCFSERSILTDNTSCGQQTNLTGENVIIADVTTIARDYTSYLNSGQTTVVCSDQPLYALKKTILWDNPAKFQKNDTCSITNLDPETRTASPLIVTPYCCYNSDVFTLFGVMHIEQTVGMKCTGDLIMGTGLEDLLGSAGLKTIGLMTSLCCVSSIKKARYGGQVIGPVLRSLLVEAYQQSTGAKDLTGLNDWTEKQEAPMFKYLLGILDHIMNVNLLVKSQREANFELFIATLEKLCPIMFALDHTHYSRWLPVFVHELKLLKITDPKLFEKFQEGYFVVRKSKTKFSSIACDQAHEQTNKLINSKSGLADVLNKEDSKYLRKLEATIPEIHFYLEEVEGGAKPQSHKETSKSFVKAFIDDIRRVRDHVSTNPFLEKGARKVNSSLIMPARVIEDMEKVFRIGVDQYKLYNETRFVKGSADVLNTSIKTNQLKLPKDAMQFLVVNPLTPLSSSDAIKLRSSCTFRPELAKELFSYDFTGAPECFLAKDGNSFHSNKAAIINCLKPPESDIVNLPGEFEAYVVDLSVEIRSKASLVKKDTLSYKQFILHVLDSIALRANQAKVHQIDIVVDFYYNLSVKSGTRTDRGISSRILFNLDDLVANNFEILLNNDEFKTDLNSKFALMEILEAWSWQGDFRVKNLHL